ncbi:F-box/FBD/LRR-repeat protein At1g13570-like [Henckelia pumila]|uniref:F-box/FBD/LRR-repeat protein At1g13570-like n=1 Tax=Henckelia pumila TaxID=405737 RepID=UPI003C6E98D3
MKTKKRDLISYLPSDIIENILKRLILRDAVMTSILSREWRYKWATLPAIVLKSYCLKLSYNQLNSAVNQILVLHQGPVKELEVKYLDLDSCHYLHQWFDLLSKDHLQKLFLSWRFGLKLKEYCRLPSNFYSFSELRYLYLSRCVFRLPSSFKGLNRLVSLKLENVKIKSNKLSSLISKSPFLECVVIKGTCYTFKALRINASKLKKFFFRGFASSVYFLNAPLLEEVHIVLIGRSYSPLPDKVKQDNFMKSLAQLSSITKLALDGFLQPMALDGVWQNLTFEMNHLKILGLEISSYELAQISCVICLLRIAPNLETLEFIISAPDPQMMTSLYLEQQREDNSISLSVLKNVLICWQSPERVDLDLVELIFSFSPALEKIYFPIWCERSYVQEVLVAMPKASPTVEISFNDMDIESRAFDFRDFD